LVFVLDCIWLQHEINHWS